MSEQETVRCHVCGKRTPEAEAIRREAKTGSFWGMGMLDRASGVYTGSQYSVVDVCPECSQRMDAPDRWLWVKCLIFAAVVALMLLFANRS